MSEIKQTGTSVSTRGRVLSQASACTLQDRNANYGEPHHNLSCLAELKAVYKKYAGSKFSATHDTAIEHVLGKIARIAAGSGKLHLDNYIDGAAYLAIAAECQDVEDNTRICAGKIEIRSNSTNQTLA